MLFVNFTLCIQISTSNEFYGFPVKFIQKRRYQALRWCIDRNRTLSSFGDTGIDTQTTLNLKNK